MEENSIDFRIAEIEEINKKIIKTDAKIQNYIKRKNRFQQKLKELSK